ncbi:MAG: GHKL domain-containing protein [Lachnospiraceae bacterium]|nr:GHKL domain-containing protein [Lachnospiraceae bacterium]
MNGGAHILLFGLISFILYFEKSSKKFIRVLETETLYIIIVISEGIGVFFIDALLKALNILPQNQEILQSIETAFSKISLLILYNAVFCRLWKKSLIRTTTQYVLYIVLFVYSIANILAIAMISDREKPLILMFNIFCTILANLYLLYFTRFYDERKYYKLQVEMMKQQQRIQYEGYEMQKEKYAMAVSILHDVDKHIKMMESLYQEELKREAFEYVGKINEMLRPLIPLDYTNNPTLNCLLSDKLRLAKKMGIDFQINAASINVDFMEPIDITTLFGNLIDNAITASSKCTDKRYISLDANAYKDMLSIRIQNSICEPVPIDNGKIDYVAKKSNGIGLLNIQRCIDSYFGSIIYKNLNGLLVCDILLNKKND